jgi:16S rRNA processing protein RimM
VVGRVRRAHGVRGAWAIEPMTEAPDVIFASGALVFAGDREGKLTKDAANAPTALTIVDGRHMNKEWLVRVREVTDRDQADLWRGRYLLVDAARIPEPDPDDVYVSALIGMTVEVEGRGVVGHVRDVYEAPQGLLLEIDMPTGRPLVPWHPDIIERVDEAARVIVIKPLEGLLE